VDEFLEKLQEDQRRMRKFLRDNAQKFKDMGALLAKTRRQGGRVFVLAEPPLEGMVQLVADEYLTQLPVIPVDLSKPSTPSVDPDSSEEPSLGRAAAAKQVVRHLHGGDLLLAFLHEGSDRETCRVLEAARARRHTIISVGGLGAKPLMKRIAKHHRVSLPTRGIKTVCEAVLLCSRVMARVSRAAWRQREADDPALIQILCDTCNERVFLPETKRGKSVRCPLCKADLDVPRTSSRHLNLPDMVEPKRGGKKRKPSRPLKPSVLEIPVANLDDSPPSLPIEESAGLRSPSPAEHEVSAPVGLVSASQEGSPLHVPSFGSGITVGSEIVSADPPPGPSERLPTLGTTVSSPADPYALEDAYMDDLTADHTSSRNVSSGIASGGLASDSRRLSSRYTASDCKLRWGRGGFPDDASPRHELISLTVQQVDFFLDPDDEAGSTLQKDDELWVRIEIPAFIEPIMVKGVLLNISGTSGSGKGTRVALEFREIEPSVRRKLVRAAENIGAVA
jgi:RNase P subunit RPR2